MLFWETSRVGGAGFCRGAPLSHIDLSGCWRKKFRNFWKIRNLFGTDAATVQRAASSAMRQTSLPARHQYGLQIVEGMVTFFESYERELEKYWTKTLFFQPS
jgi:hypothetical protein